MSDEITFGQWLKQRRRGSDLTQDELAKKIGCSTINIRKIEADERRPSKQIAHLLAECFDIPLNERENFVQFARSERPASATPATSAGQTGVVSTPWSSRQARIVKPEREGRIRSIPAARTSYIGREQDHTRLHQMILEGGARLITLTGAPGVGKTRLALEVGSSLESSFSDGACFIPLASVPSHQQVGWAIWQGLGASGIEEKQYLENLIAFLRERTFLLILDNFEHVLAAAPLVAQLLMSCPGLTVLATSREPLRIYGEHEFLVTPLVLPDFKSLVFSAGSPSQALLQFPAVRLFIQRARAVQPNFSITDENAGHIAEICFRLDGLPLAIELAAVRIKIYPPESMLLQLMNRLRFLSKGMRDFDSRHQTLRAAIEWSYQILDPDEQNLLARLAVFNGKFTEEDVRGATYSMYHSEFPIEDVFFSLTEKSLVQALEDGKHFILLETIREYAKGRLEEKGELEALKTAHACYFLRMAEQAEPYLRSPQAAIWMDRLDANYGNLRTAFAWAFGGGPLEAGLRAAACLLFYWYRRSTLSEGHLWLDTAVKALDPSVPPRLRAEVLMSSGALGYFLRGAPIFEERLKESVELWKELGDLNGLATAYFWLILISSDLNQFYQEESIRLFRLTGNDWWLAFSLWLQGVGSLTNGDADPALSSLLESERLFQQLEEPYGLSYTHAALGIAERAAGHMRSAQLHLEKALELKKAVGDQWGIAQTIKDLGDKAFITATRSEDLDLAKELLEESLARHRELNTQNIEIVYTMHRLGNVKVAQGDKQGAIELYRETLNLSQKYHIPADWIASFLIGPAQLAYLEGKTTQAAQLLGAVHGLDPRFPKLIDAAGKRMHASIQSALQEILGPEDFQQAWSEGYRLDVDQAVALACADDPAL